MEYEMVSLRHAPGFQDFIASDDPRIVSGEVVLGRCADCGLPVSNWEYELAERSGQTGLAHLYMEEGPNSFPNPDCPGVKGQ